MKPSRAAIGFDCARLVCTALLAALILIRPEPAAAASFEELYTVSVVPDPAARDVNADAAARAMRILLTRITGSRQAAEDPRLAGLISSATDHATGFIPVSAQELRISFRRSAVNDVLTGLGLPRWGDERPATLLWIAMDFGTGQRAELGASSEPGARPSGPDAGAASNVLTGEADALFDAAVEQALGIADERGLPLVLPRLDGEDRRLVRFADVWGGFDQAVAELGTRYGVDAILIGRVSPAVSGMSVRWILRRGPVRQEFVTADPGAGIERLANLFAAEYTIVGEAEKRQITISGIQEWSDWSVLEHLESLSIVERVQVRSLSRDGDLVLSVLARGSPAELRQVLTLGGELALPPADPGTNPATDTRLPPLPPAAGDALVFVPAWRVDTGAQPETR